MEELESVTPEKIQTLIYEIRGFQVMLDSDLAKLYQIETKNLNKAAQRNAERFPEDFRFQLTDEETKYLRFQIGTSNSSAGGRRYNPWVYTEQGVSMLATVLHSEVAVQVSVSIVRAFVQMRHFISANGSLFARLDSVEKKQIETEEKLNRNLLRIDEKLDINEKNFEKVFDALEAADLPKQGVFCDGQIFYSYKFVSDLIRKAKASLVLVDNYVDDTVLSMLDKRKSGVSATIYTQSISKQLTLDLQKHNAQYAPIDVRILKNFHDRFLFLDEKTIYHIGASVKDLGKKVFGFSKLGLDAKQVMNMLGVTV